MNKKRLEEYIENYMIYQDYKEDKLMNPSYFDKFCIQHCKDIEELLEENKQLINNWNILKEFINKLWLDNKGIVTKIKDKIELIERGENK